MDMIPAQGMKFNHFCLKLIAKYIIEGFTHSETLNKQN